MPSYQFQENRNQRKVYDNWLKKLAHANRTLEIRHGSEIKFVSNTSLIIAY